MNKSLTAIAVIGLLGMLSLTMFGSFFVGKVGGAERVAGLRRDLAEVFGPTMRDPKSLAVKIETREGKTGLHISYAPNDALSKARAKKSLDYQVRRLKDYVLRRKYWRKRAAFVHIRLELPGGKIVEEHFPAGNAARPELPGEPSQAGTPSKAETPPKPAAPTKAETPPKPETPPKSGTPEKPGKTSESAKGS
jgi:hypothetical protein